MQEASSLQPNNKIRTTLGHHGEEKLLQKIVKWRCFTYSSMRRKIYFLYRIQVSYYYCGLYLMMAMAAAPES